MSLVALHSPSTQTQLIQPSEISLDPDENKPQIKEQTLVPELDHQEKFRLYLQVFMELGTWSSVEGLEESTVHFVNVLWRIPPISELQAVSAHSS